MDIILIILGIALPIATLVSLARYLNNKKRVSVTGWESDTAGPSPGMMPKNQGHKIILVSSILLTCMVMGILTGITLAFQLNRTGEMMEIILLSVLILTMTGAAVSYRFIKNL